MFMKIFGRYVGPLLDSDPATGGGTTQETDQQNTEITDYEAAYKKLLAESNKKSADHAKSYSSLQTTMSKKDEELKVTKNALDERNASYNELNLLHTTLTADTEKTTKELKEKREAEVKLKADLTRKKMLLRPEYAHLSVFENDGLIPEVNAVKEDGSIDEVAIETILKKFSSSLSSVTKSNQKTFKAGEIPDEPVPEAPSTAQVLKAKALAFQKDHKMKEYNDTMDEYYKALRTEQVNK